VPRVPLLTLVAALAFLAAGCGGGGDSNESAQPEGTPPAQWVTTVCGALNDWQTSLQTQAQGLPQQVLQAGSPAAAKKEIEDFLDEVVNETQQMVDTVDEAGKPAVDSGERIRTAVHARLLKVKAAFETARQKVDAVPTDDPAAFQQQLTEIGQDLAAQGQALGDVLGSADAKPLRDAIQKTEGCKSFNGT
jgi:PBP1b-binding outer membrane lipoprotein LpoB